MSWVILASPVVFREKLYKTYSKQIAPYQHRRCSPAPDPVLQAGSQSAAPSTAPAHRPTQCPAAPGYFSPNFPALYPSHARMPTLHPACSRQVGGILNVQGVFEGIFHF